jgi:hypothetical protein
MALSITPLSLASIPSASRIENLHQYDIELGSEERLFSGSDYLMHKTSIRLWIGELRRGAQSNLRHTLDHEEACSKLKLQDLGPRV